MASGSFDAYVDSAHRDKTAAQLAALGVDALKGVSASHKQHLQSALGVNTIGELAGNQVVRLARAIQEEAAEIGHDPGPDADWSSFFAEAPLDTFEAHPTEFRLAFGPAYYRGRLDGTARVLLVGQDPAANELIGHRALVGASGQRVQGFFRRLGIHRDYLMVNTFLYPIFGQFMGTVKDLSQSGPILDFRNRLLDRIKEQNPLEVVIAAGAAAADAIGRWPGAAGLFVQPIMHPSAQDNAVLLANWNVGLAALRAKVTPEVGVVVDNTNYGTDWVDADLESIPRRDLPFGMPVWHGVGTHAERGKLADGKTDNRRIIWTAP